MNQKQQSTHHANVNLDLVKENGAIMINTDVSIIMWKMLCGKYLASIMDDSTIMCVEIIEL